MAETIGTDKVASPAAQVMDEAIELAIEERSPYPEKAAFIDADEPQVGMDILRAVNEGRAIVLVAADGSTRTLRPESLIEQVAGQSPTGTVSSLLLAALDNAYQPIEDVGEALVDPEISEALLRGLMILSSYGHDRSWRAIIDIAQQLNMSPSTTHRYVKTLRAIGLLEQDPSTKKYRPVALVGDH